ncbi:hypothetical protein ABPS01_03010 [Streptococcus sp. ZJ151]|uniref:hypothetical protein n=1 Tax=Streptococcus jiangjianxini TaxID=3161189 RepID=UPI0032ED07B4
MELPTKIIQSLISDFKEETQFDVSILIPSELTIDFEIIKLKKQQILATLISSTPLEIKGKSILEKVDNYLAIKDLGLSISKECNLDEFFENKKNNLEILLAKIELRIVHYKNYLRYFRNLLYSNKLNYKDKQRILKILNDNHDDTNLFRKIVDSIKYSDIDFEQGVPYIKTGQYLSPYLNNGNSGLIIELIKFSMREKISEYDSFIQELGNGVKHTYAKSTTLNSGLAGLGLANIWLYIYFNDSSYLSTCFKIFNHICDYTIYKADYFFIIDPLQVKIDYSYSEGMLGQYYFMDQLILLTHQNSKEYYEKIPPTI